MKWITFFSQWSTNFVETYTLPYFSGGNGVEEFNKMFTKPRGKLVNDGSKNITLKAHFHWGPVSSYKTSYKFKIF